MRTRDIIWISGISLVIGICFCSYWQGWIIIHPPSFSSTQNYLHNLPTTTKKKAKLIYWNNDAWNTEDAELIWSDDKAETIRYLINSLLTLMHEEEAIKKKISLETVMLAPNNQEAFLSFDRNPFRKEDSTFEKWMIIESILKTTRENEIEIQSIRFLVNHKPLHDYHLDFVKSWVIR